MLVTQTRFKPQYQEQNEGIQLRCPRCFGPLTHLQNEDCTPHDCITCRSRLACEQGIWKALLPERVARYSRFVEDYESIRAAEGRGSTNSAYYLALPYRDLSGRLSSQWALRARTFRYIERRILPRISTLVHKELRILDLGAGNGWMSYRLASDGHSPVAVDLLTNDQDGLGAARHYKEKLRSLFPRFQAELDNLPFSDGQFDVVIFNSSFHYSENYEKTLAEALRCVRRNGTVIIADSPWYSDERSGLLMLEERRTLFIRRYGFPSDELKSLEYLTDQRLKDMEQHFNIRWQTHEPYYGIRWLARPLLARLRRTRKPSRFRIYTAKVTK
jgi:ubiquinone/menaquinone biosynthesis C-methylase UbiE